MLDGIGGVPRPAGSGMCEAFGLSREGAASCPPEHHGCLQERRTAIGACTLFNIWYCTCTRVPVCMYVGDPSRARPTQSHSRRDTINLEALGSLGYLTWSTVFTTLSLSHYQHPPCAPSSCAHMRILWIHFIGSTLTGNDPLNRGRIQERAGLTPGFSRGFWNPLN